MPLTYITAPEYVKRQVDKIGNFKNMTLTKKVKVIFRLTVLILITTLLTVSVGKVLELSGVILGFIWVITLFSILKSGIISVVLGGVKRKIGTVYEITDSPDPEAYLVCEDVFMKVGLNDKGVTLLSSSGRSEMVAWDLNQVDLKQVAFEEWIKVRDG